MAPTSVLRLLLLQACRKEVEELRQQLLQLAGELDGIVHEDYRLEMILKHIALTRLNQEIVLKR